MSTEQLKEMLQELRDQYIHTADPDRRKVIAARGKALRNALELMEKKIEIEEEPNEALQQVFINDEE